LLSTVETPRPKCFISSFKFSGHFDEELVIPIIDNEREDYLLVERMREALQV
jgi:hypothetical protein